MKSLFSFVMCQSSPSAIGYIPADTTYILHGSISVEDFLSGTFSGVPGNDYSIDTIYQSPIRLYIGNSIEEGFSMGKSYFIWRIVSIIAIVVLTVLVVMVFHRLKKHDRQSRDLMQEMQQLVQSNRSTCEAVSILIEERVRLMQSLLSHYKETASLPNKGMHIIDQVEYLKEVNNNYRKTLEVFSGDWSFLSKLEQALNAGKSNIMSRVRDIYGDTITENDYLILAGLFAGMSTAVISFYPVLRRAPSGLRKAAL